MNTNTVRSHVKWAIRTTVEKTTQGDDRTNYKTRDLERKSKTFLPAILQERLPMQRGEKVRMVLTISLLPKLIKDTRFHEENDDITDEDDKFPESQKAPESLLATS